MSKDIVILATADWAEKYWTNKQRMAVEFAKRGYRVLYVESFGLRAPGANKKDFSRLFRRLITGLKPAKKVADNIWVLSPLVLPKWNNKAIKKFNYSLIALRLKIFRFLNHFDTHCLWTYHPYILPLIKKLKTQKNYYHIVDNISAVPGIDQQSFEQAEQALFEKLSAIFVTSVTLQADYQKKSPKLPVIYSPNVVDVLHFAQARKLSSEPVDLADIKKPRLVYCGVLSDFKVNFKLLTEVAKAKPEWEIVLIGEEREGQQSTVLANLKQLPNVHCLGYRPYKELTDYLSSMDIGILPLQDNTYTRYMFPMKFFEFLAAGLPVVSTKVAALVPYEGYFYLGNSTEQFIEAISQCLTDHEKKGALSVDEMRATYSWDARMTEVISTMNENMRAHA